jgi:hypothetical protein
MECKLVVNCQYYENYSVGPDGFGEVPHWKPKGGHTFQMPIDSDVVMYTDDEIMKKAIINLIESQNSIAERFEYREHRVVFSEPTLVNGLQTEIQKLYEVAV